jgi:hypothetical protein
MPYLIGTHFGYVVMGSAPVKHYLSSLSSPAVSPNSNFNPCVHDVSDSNLNDSQQQEKSPTASHPSKMNHSDVNSSKLTTLTSQHVLDGGHIVLAQENNLTCTPSSYIQHWKPGQK